MTRGDLTVTTMTAAVFAAAETTKWTRTNLGDRTEVAHAGYTWAVERPTTAGPARIVGREGWGGFEFLDITEPLKPADASQVLPAPPVPALASDRALARLAALIAY